MTDVNPNRCGEPMNPLKKTHTPWGGEEVRDNPYDIKGSGDHRVSCGFS